jgi:hypothetical protein
MLSHSHLLIPFPAETATASGLHALNVVSPSARPPPRSARSWVAAKSHDALRLTTKETDMRSKRLTLQQRQELFHALVTNQDLGMSVAESRQQVSQQFEVAEDDVRKIEDEGIEKEWPPLNEAAIRSVE